jgi:hypothetical protein
MEGDLGMLSGVIAGAALGLWVLLTVRVKGWEWLLGVMTWPGAQSVALLQRLTAGVLTPTQRRGMAITARLAAARFRCWQLGIKNHPR